MKEKILFLFTVIICFILFIVPELIFKTVEFPLMVVFMCYTLSILLIAFTMLKFFSYVKKEIEKESKKG